MNIFDGLEKFGLKSSGKVDLFGEEKKNAAQSENKEAQKEAELSEEDFIMDRNIKCTVCDQMFKVKSVKTSKLRRMEPDKDLRPRFQYIDTLKYDVLSCPYCGYTAMSRYFEHISTLQIKMIRESVCSQFKASVVDVPDVYDYEYAVDHYKLSLFNTIAKKGKTSEKAYTCLKIAWLLRGKAEELLAKGKGEDSEEVKAVRKEERAYYEQAYEGMGKAIESEPFPICGMEQNTVDLLMAEMAYNLERYEDAYRFLSRLLTSRNAGSNLKNRGLDLKEEILAKMKEIKK